MSQHCRRVPMETQKKIHFFDILLDQKSQQFNCGINNLELKEQDSTPIFLLNFKVYIAWQIVTLKCFLPFYPQQLERQDNTKKSPIIHELASSCYLHQQYSLKINHSDKGISHTCFYKNEIWGIFL